MVKKAVKKKIKKKISAAKHPVKVIKKTVTTTTTTTPIKPTAKKKSTKKKKAVKKKTAKKRTNPIRRSKIPKDDAKLQRALIENFIALQKVMVNLSAKFDDLSTNISKLLELFEISAKALAEKDLTVEKTAKDDERIMKKMDNLYEQNRVIARGLTLMHDRLSEEPEERIKERDHMPFPIITENPSREPPMPRTPPMQPPMKRSLPQRPIPTQGNIEGYQKSIASEQSTEFKKLPQ